MSERLNRRERWLVAPLLQHLDKRATRNNRTAKTRAERAVERWAWRIAGTKMPHDRYWRGRWRIRHGFCPLCNSSPPNMSCEICGGERPYGPLLPEVSRQRWRQEWDARS